MTKQINFCIDEKLYTDNEIEDVGSKIRSREIMSKKDIPLPKSKAEKALTKTQQNNLIRKIPDNMFTEAEILKIVEHIRNGTMTNVSQMTNPTDKEPKVPLSTVVFDKMNTKREL